MKHPAPRAGQAFAPHWQAAAENRLSLPFCIDCSTFQWPPRRRCPRCEAALTWRDSTGLGSVASYSIIHRAVNPDMKDEVPYIVAFVELDDGVRLFTNIVDIEPKDVRVGMRVRCRFEPAMRPEFSVPVFVAAEGAV